MSLPTNSLLVVFFGVLVAAPAAAQDLAADGSPARTSHIASSFTDFAEAWMTRLQSSGTAPPGPRGKLTLHEYDESFTTEIRPTGHPVAKYVGLLRYVDRELTCAADSPTRCAITAATRVTEIFRYEDGAWIY